MEGAGVEHVAKHTHQCGQPPSKRPAAAEKLSPSLTSPWEFHLVSQHCFAFLGGIDLGLDQLWAFPPLAPSIPETESDHDCC